MSKKSPKSVEYSARYSLNTGTGSDAHINEKRKKKSTRIILDAAKLIAPVIEENYIDGYNWIIDYLKGSKSNYHGVQSEIEIKKAINFIKEKRIDDAIQTGNAKSRAGQPDMQAMIELIRQVDAADPIEKLENTLKRDPSLAFKLMRYINSPAFGLRVEISSFRHAIMMLGYKRLKRWVALLLATASKDVNMKPVMFAAVRRGLLMEELGRASSDEEMRSELFICGVFSLLDRMFQQPFSELLANIPVPERVQQALVDETGPFQPFVHMVRAIENESLFDFREAADALMMSVSEINRAQLRALTAASQLE